MIRWVLVAFALAGAVALFSARALGVDVAGVRFVDRVVVGDASLVLNGVGIRKATIFKVKVYVAALYVAERTRSAAEILRPDRLKSYTAVMKRDVSRDDSAPVFHMNIERSAGADATTIRSEIAAFERWIPSMREGQNLTATFVPESGVTVRSTARKDAFHGTVRFGTALFGVWIGPTASDDDFRAALLSGKPNS